MENEADEEMDDEKREPQELNGIFFLKGIIKKIKVAFQLKHTIYYYVHYLYIYCNSANHNSAIKKSEQLN